MENEFSKNIKERQEKLLSQKNNKYSWFHNIKGILILSVFFTSLAFLLNQDGCHTVGDTSLERLEDGHQYFKTWGTDGHTLEHAAGCDHSSHKSE